MYLKMPLFKFVVAFVIWIVIFFVIFYMKDDYLQLAPRKYPMYPLCYIGAILWYVDAFRTFSFIVQP